MFSNFKSLVLFKATLFLQDYFVAIFSGNKTRFVTPPNSVSCNRAKDIQSRAPFKIISF